MRSLLLCSSPIGTSRRYQLSVWSLLVMTLGLQLGYSRIVCLTATLTLMSETG
jgi:hypothetical protein